MIVMALDHTRDFFTNYSGNPTDLEHASTIMFLTRWVTHYCAPVFIFLAGTSAYLSSRKNVTAQQASRHLLTRGLWLILVEVTLVFMGWTFAADYTRIILQVIWAVGCCMVFLSALVYLPWQVILAIGLLLIFGHNAFDGYNPPAQGVGGILWHFLHIQGPIVINHAHTIMVIYPLIPWIGVMAVGYCMGRVFTRPAAQRDKTLFSIGIGAIVLFILLRFSNLYGDPTPWAPQHAWWRTILSFINCSKYPPSLLYLLMTLGPAITALPLLERIGNLPGKIFTVYGRVPMFYYLLHIYLIHFMAVAVSAITRQNAPVSMLSHPGYSLPLVYLFWLSAVSILYLPCLWFMRVKMKHKWWWLGYL
jgi:uncharacterized membrane protein